MPTELLPQPPPGVPAPPPGRHARRTKQRFKNLVTVGVLVMLPFVLFTLWRLHDLFFRGKPNANPITAIRNAKEIGTALLEFDNQYGNLPDATTALRVKAETGSTWSLSDATSNDLFQQLFVTGIAFSEDIFYAKTPWSKKSDNVFTTESQALAAGECGFAYIAGLSWKDDPSTPICVSPLEPGKLTFDRKSFDGKAIVLRLDNIAISYSIDKSGHVILPNGMDLFDPRQPFWHGKAPNVKWPK